MLTVLMPPVWLFVAFRRMYHVDDYGEVGISHISNIIGSIVRRKPSDIERNNHIENNTRKHRDLDCNEISWLLKDKD